MRVLTRPCSFCRTQYVGRYERFCSPTCRLRFWSDPVGDCWIWNGSVNRHAPNYGSITVDNKTWGVTNYVASVAGVTKGEGERFFQTCGNSLCCKPEHMGTGPEYLRHLNKGSNRLTLEQVQTIYALKDTGTDVKTVAAQYGKSEWTIRYIWTGRTHRKITGAIPKNKKVDK